MHKATALGRALQGQGERCKLSHAAADDDGAANADRAANYGAANDASVLAAPTPAAAAAAAAAATEQHLGRTVPAISASCNQRAMALT